MTRDAKLRFYTTVKIGPKRHKTPEGFLLCEGVAIARTGEQLYSANSVPVEAGPDGLVVIERRAEEVFRPETIASFNGKPVCDDHPDVDVVPANWSRLAKGVILHPRRGEGDESELLLADLLICDAGMIQAVDDGKEEVSCGYDADYRQFAPGRGEQYDIVGNHLAIVEAGRCGSRCRIGDSADVVRGGAKVAKKGAVANLVEAMRAKFRDSGNEEELKKALDSKEVKDAMSEAEKEEEGDTHVHVKVEDAAPRTKFTDAALEERFKSLDEKLDEILDKKKTDDSKGKDEKDPEEKKDEKKGDESKTEDASEEEEKELKEEGVKDAKKTRDSAEMVDSFQEMIALGEIIAPGIRIPTLDAAASPKRTLDAMCAFRRKALLRAAETRGTDAVVTEIRRGKALTHDAAEALTCSQVRDLFHQVGTTLKIAETTRRAAGVRTADTATNTVKAAGAAPSNAELNTRAAAYWADRVK